MIDNYIFKTRYAKFLGQKNRRETWPECVARTINHHQKKTGLVLDEIAKAMEQKKILGSQRILQFAGAALEKNEYRAYNCTAAHLNRPEFFHEFYYLLLSGCGAGYSVEYGNVYRLPIIKADSGDRLNDYTVADTIEGWADAVKAVASHFFYGAPLPIFDFTEIREKGSPISHGGRAPGPEVLQHALGGMINILDRNRGRKLEPIECFRICCILADSIITERRSATICIFSAEDENMQTAKIGEWYENHPYYARANISPRVEDKEAYDTVIENTQQWGEPGGFFGKGVPNPCLEIGMDPGEGWGFCNLTTINCSTLESAEDFLLRCRLAAELGTIQATYTQLGYLGETTKAVQERDALLGVSLCGVIDSPIELTEELLERGVEVVRETNKRYAAILKINPAARLTCVKPEGTTSLLLGCVGAGIHNHPGETYLRRVQSSPGCPITQYHAAVIPESVEDNIWSDGKVTTFPIQVSNYTPESALRTLRRIVHFQRHWVLKGTNNSGLDAPRHNVSCTVVVRKSEWEAVAAYVWAYRGILTGVSFLPAMEDNLYSQLPQEPISQTDPRWIKLLEAYKRKINYDLFEEREEGRLQVGGACDGPKCEVMPLAHLGEVKD